MSPGQMHGPMHGIRDVSVDGHSILVGYTGQVGTTSIIVLNGTSTQLDIRRGVP